MALFYYPKYSGSHTASCKPAIMLTQLTHTQIERVLAAGHIGRIGYKNDADEVSITPVNYKYKDGCVQCFSIVGDKINMMRKHTDVCFEVEDIADNDNWKTVVCHGRYEEITDEQELQLLRPQYTEYLLRKRATVTDAPPDAAPPTSVFYRIRFSKFTGRADKEA